MKQALAVNKTEELLAEMGFSWFGGNIYKHNEIGMVTFADKTPTGIVLSLLEAGKRLKENEIRTVLGI